MPRKEVINLDPEGWESDPVDEYLKLSTIDYCVTQVYNNYAMFFKLSDEEKPKTIPVLKRGLKITLSQCRQLCGTLEEHPDGGLCFHKKKEDTVEFHVQWLDGPEDEGKYPSMAELEKRHFIGLGDLETWCVMPMTFGEKPEARPENKPKVAAFKATFIRGGLVFMMHNHHFANDITGWAGSLHQLAENCAAIWKSADNPILPPWDKACMDNSPFSRPDPPEDQRIDGPPTATRHPDHKPSQWLLFHLPKSKMAELKRLASPEDGSYWISTHDAYTAYLWQFITKHRAALHKSDLEQKLIFIEAINMRKRCDKPLPPRMQGNVLAIGQLPDYQLTVGEVISGLPLSKLACANQASLDRTLAYVASVRNKLTLYLSGDSMPPLSNVVTDWRESVPCEADFGFGRPCAMRHPFETVTPAYNLIYPVRDGPAGADEGVEVVIGFEKDATEALLADPEWNRFFEFRGIDEDDKYFK